MRDEDGGVVGRPVAERKGLLLWLDCSQWGQGSCSFRQNMAAVGSKATFALVSGVIEAISEVAAELFPCPPPPVVVNWH